jgi:hypothetical protein
MSNCFLIPELNFESGWLKSHLQPGDRIIALRLAEFVRLRDLMPGVTAVEEWIPYAEMKRLALRAYEINQAFSAESCGGELLDGYDWPRICIDMHVFFFRDILLAEALAEALKKEPWEKIVWVGNARQEACLMLPTDNVVAHTFWASFGNRWEVLEPPHRGNRNPLALLRQKALVGFQLLRKKMIFLWEKSISPCQIMAIFPPTEEWARFSNALEDLHKIWGTDFQIWSVGRVPKGMQAWADGRGTRAVWLPYPDAVGKETRAFFHRHWGRWSSGGRYGFAEREGCRALANDHLAYHFDFYFNKIWPRVAEYSRVLEKYLQAARPRYLIGSTDVNTTQLFVYAVAQKMGIPSIALPHGSVQEGNSLIGSSFLASRNLFERTHFIRSFPEESRVLYCSNSANELSYQPSSAGPPLGSGKKAVLILSSNVEVDHTQMPMADRVAMVESFRRLKDVPEDLRDLEFVVKGHPRWNLSAMIREIDLPAPTLRVLDSGLSLLELVEKSWAVVMFNYFGSAVVHAIRAEKPLLFLNSAQLYWPHTEWLSFPAGEVIEEVSGLWDLLRRLKESPRFYGEMQERCRRFKAENLAVPGATLGQAIRALKADPASGQSFGESLLGRPNSSLPLHSETIDEKIFSVCRQMENPRGQAREGLEGCRCSKKK